MHVILGRPCAMCVCPRFVYPIIVSLYSLLSQAAIFISYFYFIVFLSTTQIREEGKSVLVRERGKTRNELVLRKFIRRYAVCMLNTLYQPYLPTHIVCEYGDAKTGNVCVLFLLLFGRGKFEVGNLHGRIAIDFNSMIEHYYYYSLMNVAFVCMY